MKIKSIIFAAFVLFILWIGLPYIFIKLNQIIGFQIYILGPFRFIGIFFIFAGLIISTIASFTFLRFGEGTPAITEPPKKLVIKGLYKRTRNPIYLAHILISLGLFIFLGYLSLLIYTGLIVICLNLYLINVEEPLLKKRFGEDYIKYTQKIPRWL